MSDETPNPYEALGGEVAARALAHRFYEHMEAQEPVLAKLHRCDADGRIDAEVKERFALFLIGWLGGPQTYMERYGHPRLRMRHGHVPVNVPMRDAWVRCMLAALSDASVPDAKKPTS